MQMSWKENVVHKNDTERYKIAVPFNFLFGKKRQKYISSELEKRHPCFTDDFGFDSVLTLVHGKPMLDVVVAKKIKLEENIADLKKRKFVYAAGFVFFVICLLLFSFVIVFNHKNDKTKAFENDEKEDGVEQTNVQYSAGADGFSGFDFCDFLFEIIGKNNGRIRELSLKYDCFTQTVEALAKGIYPEQFSEIYSDLFISPVSYESEVPVLKCKYKGKVKIDKKNETCDLKSFLPRIRKVLVQCDGDLIEESINPISFRFNYGDVEKILREIDCVCKDENVGITQFDIAENQKTILFDKDVSYCDGIKLKNICDNIRLFDVHVKHVKKTTISEKKATEMKIAKNIAKNITKIGEVKYQDGTTNVFYKDSNGKLVKERM